VLDGKDSEDSSGPIGAVTEDSSEATNDSLSVVINSEETSREAVTNGNDTTNDNSNGHETSNDAPASNGNGGTTDADELVEPSSKKIRLQTDEGAP